MGKRKNRPAGLLLVFALDLGFGQAVRAAKCLGRTDPVCEDYTGH
jgi:hypothetical protein